VEAHLAGVAVGSAFVFGMVMEALARWFTVWMRDARVLALGRGGRRSDAKSKAMNASSARTPQGVLLFSIFAISATWTLNDD
jgi:hypothetical protein